MRKINYRSDFKELVTLSGVGCVNVPFRFTYRTGSASQPFVAYWDGAKCLNCRIIDENHVLVIFDRKTHSLSAGRVSCKREFFMNDTDFFDGICNFVSEELTDIELTTGITESDDFSTASNVLINALRGEGMSEAEKTAFREEIMLSVSEKVSYYEQRINDLEHKLVGYETLLKRVEDLTLRVEKLEKIAVAIDNETDVVTLGTKQYKLEEYVYITQTEYSNVSVALSYTDIPASGGSVNPKLTYSQTRTDHYSNGTTKTTTITSGGTVAYLSGNGVVSAVASTNTTRHKITTMNAVVTLNGKNGSASADVYQAAYVEQSKYRVGSVDATRSGFTTLTAEELKASSVEKTVGGAANYTANKNCFFVLVPTTKATLAACSYTSGGLVTDIMANDAWNVTHNDIMIDNITYKVYGYRNGGVSTSEPQVYDFTINKK